MSDTKEPQSNSNQPNKSDDASGEVDLERLARLYADDFDEFEDSDEVSLEDLSKSYAKVVSSDSTQAIAGRTFDSSDDEIQIFDPLEEELNEENVIPVSPISIVEAVLLVGRPDGGPISATEIAGLMRGVTEAEVDQLIAELNEDYANNRRAFHVALVGGAYRLELSQDLTEVRDRFWGPTREVRLNQAAIDCLALVAYQPGITRDKLDQQRGQPSGSVLNQLVRRELLEMRREKEDKKVQPHYYPTNRMLSLVGLESLEDLPTVEDWNG